MGDEWTRKRDAILRLMARAQFVKRRNRQKPRDYHDDEEDPGFENAVRTIEECNQGDNSC